MAMDLARLPESVPPPDAVRIDLVDDPAAIDAYVRVVIRAMEIDHWQVPPDAARIRTDAHPLPAGRRPVVAPVRRVP